MDGRLDVAYPVQYRPAVSSPDRRASIFVIRIIRWSGVFRDATNVSAAIDDQRGAFAKLQRLAELQVNGTRHTAFDQVHAADL